MNAIIGIMSAAQDEMQQEESKKSYLVQSKVYSIKELISILPGYVFRNN
jgi:hypothetical protein